MGYYITERTVNNLVEFARMHPDYDFHTETIGYDAEVLSCIFNTESDDDSFIIEMEAIV